MKKISWIVALMLALLFVMVSCETPTDSPDVETFKGESDDGIEYILTITDGKDFELKVGDKISKGTVQSKEGDTYVLIVATTPFTVIVNAKGITSISGTITFTDGTSSEPIDITVKPGEDPNLKDYVVEAKDIILKQCGAAKYENNSKIIITGNKFKLDKMNDIENIGFYYDFPEAVKGKNFGSIKVEMEVLSVVTPNFVSFMTLSKSDLSGKVNVIDKKTETQKTGPYDNEFMITSKWDDDGEAVEGSSVAGSKNEESFPFKRFTDKIVFQCNAYAGKITTTGWTEKGTAEYEIAVTKITFVGNAAADTIVDEKAISGVTAPVAGATPKTTITASDQYTGTITWAPAATTFAEGTVYTATITLTPKEGFTLTGIAEDFFTVAGATSATNAANSGVVTAAFPATEAPPVLPDDLIMLGDMDAFKQEGKQGGWDITKYIKDANKAPKYLLLSVGAGGDGLGGTEVAINTKTGGWKSTKVSGDWNFTGPEVASAMVIIIDLSKCTGYSTIVLTDEFIQVGFYWGDNTSSKITSTRITGGAIVFADGDIASTLATLITTALAPNSETGVTNAMWLVDADSIEKLFE